MNSGFVGRIGRSRRLRGVGVMLISAAVVFGLFVVTWSLSFFLPSAFVTNVVGGNVIVGMVLVHVVVPLAVVLAYRWPWWVRWAAAGVLLFNIVILAVYGFSGLLTTR